MQEGGFIFISHVEEDEEIALKIADGLEEAGYTAWYYERDSLPGKSYVEQIFEAIQQSQVVVLIISKDSLNSFQVTKEIESAYENQMKFIPILSGIAQTEFQQRQPLWRHCLGTATSVKIPSAGVESIIPRIILGIKALKIEPKAPRPKDEVEPKEEIDKKEEVSAEKKDVKTDKLEEKAKEDKTGIEIITPSKTLPKEILGKDGTPMVLIPAGEFEIGDNDLNNAKVHTVYLDAFYIDKYEVTNAQYKKFMDATGYKAPNYWNYSRFNATSHPVVGVSWDDAVAYTKWAEKRLPTEAEWEKAAKGGLKGKKYPWGDNLTPDDANYSGTGGKDKWEYTSPVGSFAPNGYRLYDMAGNVWEWCVDWYADDYYANSPKSNPKGPDSGSYCVLRGGSWCYYDHSTGCSLRVASRFFHAPTDYDYFVGFRCVSGLSLTL